MSTPDPILADLDQRVSAARSYISEAYKAQLISKDVYHKCLLSVAYEYAVAGYVDETLAIVNGIEPSYFRGAAPKQMDLDPEFKKVAQTVAETLMYTGYLGAGTTMPVANA